VQFNQHCILCELGAESTDWSARLRRFPGKNIPTASACKVRRAVEATLVFTQRTSFPFLLTPARSDHPLPGVTQDRDEGGSSASRIRRLGKVD
jgi:hypothetical protein